MLFFGGETVKKIRKEFKNFVCGVYILEGVILVFYV